MNKQSNTRRSYRIKRYTFKRSIFSDNVFMKIDGPTPSLLNHITVTDPRKEYMKRAGAVKVIECFRGNARHLFSGLIPVSIEHYKGWHFGDAINKTTQKRHLLVAFLHEDKVVLFIYNEDFNSNGARKRIVLYGLKKGFYSEIETLR